MEFLKEHWDIIKGYAGIYHITTCWDFKKLDNNELDRVIKYIPKNNFFNQMNSFDNRIRYIWIYLDKSKLFEVYNEFKYQLNIQYDNNIII
uniref:Uncharacterized protein n=1 Tax=viral metagenome TaxID=1070528 RepID=A0A6C0ETH6_9ZZZZ